MNRKKKWSSIKEKFIKSHSLGGKRRLYKKKKRCECEMSELLAAPLSSQKVMIILLPHLGIKHTPKQSRTSQLTVPPVVNRGHQTLTPVMQR